MQTLRISLFGTLQATRGGQPIAGLTGHKVQELLAYLLLHRRRHAREALACLLWEQSTTAPALKNLRQTLWQLQHALDGANGTTPPLLLADTETLGLNPTAPLWLDVAEAEAAFVAARGIAPAALGTPQVAALEAAVASYRGDLLEGWYEEWCLFERERLRGLYLGMLDKLMGHCEAHRRYEAGVAYGARILQHDRARERTHRRLMHLHALAGERTAALRQYEHCVAALREELDVAPSARTRALFTQIQQDRLPTSPQRATAPPPTPEPMALPQALARLKQLQLAFAETQRQLHEAIQAVEQAMQAEHPPS